MGVWKEILKEANWCWDNMMFKVGKGTKVKFGLITGVVTRCCPEISLSYLPWRSIGMQRLTMCGTLALVKGVGI